MGTTQERGGTDGYSEACIEREIPCHGCSRRGEKRTALIGNEKGVTIFRQEDVEVPKSWSQTATNIVTSKYFHGKPGTPQREGSVRQLIGRVVNTIVRWGKECGYFADAESRDAFRDELTHLLLEQKMAFNSPVWFNVGVQPKPQCSRCAEARKR